MKTSLGSLISHPNQFFSKFEGLPPKWLVAYCGYYSTTLIESIGNLAYGETRFTAATILLRSMASSFVGAFLNLLFFGGLWMYLGSRIFGGRAGFKATLQAVGYAFFFPGILGLLTAPLMLFSLSSVNSETTNLVLVSTSFIIQLIAGIAALVYAAIAIKQINGFNWPRTLGVLLWVIIFFVLIALIGLIIKLVSS